MLASKRIRSTNFSKFKPLYLAISGTRDKPVMPGCVLISNRKKLLLKNLKSDLVTPLQFND